MIVEFAKSAALLVALCFLYGLILRYGPTRRAANGAMAGLLFGAIAVTGMIMPIQLENGVIFDPRSVILAVGALFAGPVAGLVSGLMAGGYRLWLGPPGDVVGVSVIAASVALGLVYRAVHARGRVGIGFVPLLVFGFLVHAVAGLLFLALPADVVTYVMTTVTPPFVMVLTPATALLGLLMRDVQDRARMEQSLLEREQLYHSIITTAHDGFWLLDSGPRVMEVNDAYLRMTGWRREDVIGQPPNAFALDETEDDVRNRAARLLECGRDRFESRHRTRVGEPIDVEVGLTFSPISGGRAFAFIRDISDRKRYESALLSAKTAAEESNRAKSEFLAAMSHDLRTPLNAIMGFADMMRMRTFGPLGDARYEAYADHIYNSGSLLVSLVNDVLDLSKVEAGKYVLEDAALNLTDVMEMARSNTSIMAEAADQTVVLDVPADLPLLRCDQRALLQILNNLLSNAIKFNERAGTIRFQAEQDADARLLIRVIDHGIGMDAEGVDKALRPFEQANSQAPHRHEGTGLGLYLCCRLMTLMNGALLIDSAPGVGTTVTLLFPSARTVLGEGAYDA